MTPSPPSASASLQSSTAAAGACGSAASADALAWSILAVPVRVILGGIFIAAAYVKLRPSPGRFIPSGPEDFAGSIKAFKLGLPDGMIQTLTFTVPWMEAVAAVALIIGLWTRAAAAVLSALLIGFTILVMSAIFRDLNVKCGCFGESGLICSGAVGWCKVLENGLLLAAAVALMLTRTHLLSTERALGCRPSK